MKLLSRQYKAYLLLTLPLFLLVAVGYYYFLLSIITNKADESLREDKSYIVSQLATSEELGDLMLDLTDDYILHKVDDRHHIRDQFSTLMIYDELEEAEDPYRQLTCSIVVGSDYYDLTIRKSLVEYNSIMYSILILGMVFLTTLSIGYVLINRYLTRSLWKPFYQTLSIISTYSPESNQSLLLESSKIVEFERLNQTVMRMSQKIRNDFLKQKKFIDHVAHEIQTPLTVIRANLENLLQSSKLKESEYSYLENSLESTAQLSRITKSLLLLSRIENNQFEEIQRINLTALMIDYFQINDDQLLAKKLTFAYDAQTQFKTSLNPVLAEILVSNLCRNAIRHSRENSEIRLVSQATAGGMRLELSNTGQLSDANPEKLFEMFQKQSADPDSLGIGLAIVKEICNRYQIRISYSVHEAVHTIVLEK